MVLSLTEGIVVTIQCASDLLSLAGLLDERSG
jgi:hypothetical protein